MASVIEINENMTVGELAEVLQLPATRLIGELFKNGVVATINERLDFDTAQIIVGELGIDVELKRKVVEVEQPKRQKSVPSANAEDRPPVVAVMGHVDHGKTSLLDRIRGAEVAKGEAGGITQHISAYTVERKGRPITFLDTPGHEAFAAIREHGAHLTDIVIIVVAADDGVKPQTIEAIRFARKAGVRIVVAINKIDKEGANENQVKQQLAEQELLVEEWGGDIVAVPVSAKTKARAYLICSTCSSLSPTSKNSRRTRRSPARGLIIEAHVEHGRGPIAHALIEEGTLKAWATLLSPAVPTRKYATSSQPIIHPLNQLALLPLLSSVVLRPCQSLAMHFLSSKTRKKLVLRQSQPPLSALLCSEATLAVAKCCASLAVKTSFKSCQSLSKPMCRAPSPLLLIASRPSILMR
jgi:translation initiation factor IF-2